MFLAMATQGERRAETRQRLLDAAADLFAARGDRGLSSVDAIAERAERTSGADLRPLRRQGGLLFALLEGWVDDVAAVIAAELVAADTLDERLAALWRNVTDPPTGDGRWIRARARALVLRRPRRARPASTWPAATAAAWDERRRRRRRVDRRRRSSARRPDGAARDRRAARPRDDAPHRPVRHRRPTPRSPPSAAPSSPPPPGDHTDDRSPTARSRGSTCSPPRGDEACPTTSSTGCAPRRRCTGTPRRTTPGSGRSPSTPTCRR